MEYGDSFYLEPVVKGIQLNAKLPAFNASLDEVIAFSEANRDLMMQSDVGRAVMKLIDSGNHKRLKRFWRGRTA